MCALAVEFHSFSHHITCEMMEQATQCLRDDISADRLLHPAVFRIESQGIGLRPFRTEKSERRTVDQLFDRDTKNALSKMVDGGLIDELSECISTSKDADVFIGVRGAKAPEDWPEEFAVKISKPSPSKFNPNIRPNSKIREICKNVNLWAEKEFRNLSRLYNHRIPSPCPLLVQSGILLMELITEGGVPAPSLRDAPLDHEDYEELYEQILIDMRHLFQRCHLVRVDLSEYNIRIRDKQAIWVGAGQSVERDNLNAIIFLRNDIAAVTKFFKAAGVQTAPLMRAFEFVVEENLVSGVRSIVAAIREMPEHITANEFLRVFIPQNLGQVTEIELTRVASGAHGRAPLHGPLTGVAPSQLALPEGAMCEDEEEEEEDELEDGEDEQDDEEEEVRTETLNRKSFAKEEWKVKLKEIKLANRERRNSRTPKLEKRQRNRRCHRNSK
jgi:RIO kinase 1